ncbi:MAG: outer membrane protein Omp38 [Burkholderiaceae bacterium]|nr:outer membrane protein Omp38 [Burkholderiaceae bacterium]
MSLNLLDLAKSSLVPILVSKAGSLFGLEGGVASKALDAILPTLLSGILNKSSTAQGTAGLLSAITDKGVDANILHNLPNLLASESGVHSLGEQGGKILGSLFGDKANGLGEQLGHLTGAPAQATSGIKGLTALVAPALFGMLKNYVVGNNLNANGLSNLLANQIPHLEKTLPAQIASWLGWGSIGGFFGNLASKFGGALGDATSGTLGAVGGATVAGGKSAGGLLKWLLPLLILGAIALWALRSCGTATPAVKAPVAPPTVTPPVVSAPAAPAPFDANAAMGDAKSKYLTALAALEASGKCDGAALSNALGLYVVNFASGSAALPTADIIELKKAVPAMQLCAKAGVKLSVVGHTDNVGNPASNLKLSEARAKALKAMFAKEGIPTDLMTASGKGDTEPVGDNTTEEGRFKNRRISYGAN